MVTYWLALHICERVAAHDEDFVVHVREPESCVCEILIPHHLARGSTTPPRDGYLHPSFGVGHGDLGHLERPLERLVGAVDIGAVHLEDGAEGTLVADAKWVRDVDVATP